MKIVKILSGIIAAALLLSLAGCVKPDPGESTNGGKETSSFESSETASGTSANGAETGTPDDSAEPVYQLPVGAESPYELYETVLRFLKSGFHYDDMEAIYDQNLTITFLSKSNIRSEMIFTLGLPYDESCALSAKLLNKAAEMRKQGTLNIFDVDYDAFKSELPPSMQSHFGEIRGSFESFIDNYIIKAVRFGIYRDGENPFGEDLEWIEWKEKSENELSITEYRYYETNDADLIANFPQIYVMDMGNYYINDANYETEVYYVKIDNRYYLVGFECMVTFACG